MKDAESPTLFDIPLTRIDGTPATLADYAGKVLLIVNVASKCGFTRQYDGLEALYRDDRERGLVVLGFPSNDFKGQEPGTEAEIADFCRLTFGVDFPMFAKVHTNGPGRHPLYQALTDAHPDTSFRKRASSSRATGTPRRARYTGTSRSSWSRATAPSSAASAPTRSRTPRH